MIVPRFLRTTFETYQDVAVEYDKFFRDEIATKPLDRAMIDAFAGLVLAAGSGPVADIGCGAGRMTAHLNDLGVPVHGIDISPNMIEVAGRAHPGLRFEVGSMLDLNLPDDSLGGVLGWYAISHIPDDHLPVVLAEFHRVLAPGAYVLLSFHVGDEPLHLDEAFGHTISLDFYMRQPETVAELLERAGLPVHARMVREPNDSGQYPDHTQQAFLLARKHVP